MWSCQLVRMQSEVGEAPLACHSHSGNVSLGNVSQITAFLKARVQRGLDFDASCYTNDQRNKEFSLSIHPSLKFINEQKEP